MDPLNEVGTVLSNAPRTLFIAEEADDCPGIETAIGYCERVVYLAAPWPDQGFFTKG